MLTVSGVWVDPSTRQQLPAHVLYIIVPSWRGRAGAGMYTDKQHNLFQTNILKTLSLTALRRLGIENIPEI